MSRYQGRQPSLSRWRGRTDAQRALLACQRQGPIFAFDGPENGHEDQSCRARGEEGGFWAEVPAIPGCATQGETIEELLRNVREAIEGCLSVDPSEPKPGGKERILEIAV